MLGFYGQGHLVDGFFDGGISDSLRGGGFLFRYSDAVAGRIFRVGGNIFLFCSDVCSGNIFKLHLRRLRPHFSQLVLSGMIFAATYPDSYFLKGFI